MGLSSPVQWGVPALLTMAVIGASFQVTLAPEVPIAPSTAAANALGSNPSTGVALWFGGESRGLWPSTGDRPSVGVLTHSWCAGDVACTVTLDHDAPFLRAGVTLANRGADVAPTQVADANVRLVRPSDGWSVWMDRGPDGRRVDLRTDDVPGGLGGKWVIEVTPSDARTNVPFLGRFEIASGGAPAAGNEPLAKSVSIAGHDLALSGAVAAPFCTSKGADAPSACAIEVPAQATALQYRILSGDHLGLHLQLVGPGGSVVLAPDTGGFIVGRIEADDVNGVLEGRWRLRVVPGEPQGPVTYWADLVAFADVDPAASRANMDS